MKIWIYADTHFGHDMLVEHGHRPYDFEHRIFNALRKIPAEDVLLHLGDVCIGRDALRHATWIKSLPCKKWLVRGNHDKKSYSWYLEYGWDHVCEYMCLRLYGKRILFVHDPQIGTEFNEVLPASRKNDLLIHGHWHNIDRVPEEKIKGNCLLFAPENEDYQALTLEKMVKRYDDAQESTGIS